MYKCTLSYDGSRYFGWQKTITGPSIQEELEKAIFQITREKASPEAASRTDRGVHARGQVVQFSLAKSWDPKTLQRALNAVLPSDIKIQSLEFCNFHPTLDATGKEYHYQITPTEDPTLRLYAWYFRHPLDVKKMEAEAKKLLGTHDFSAFTNEVKKNSICTLHSIAFQDFTFQILGNRFLYKMVRNLVGTLLYIGCGKLDATIEPILASKDRKKGGITAPAHGLHLHQVFY